MPSNSTHICFNQNTFHLELREIVVQIDMIVFLVDANCLQLNLTPPPYVRGDFNWIGGKAVQTTVRPVSTDT